jgi:hypothetical protein
MTKEEFNKVWSLTYNKSLPISNLFKIDFKEKWFRIHSLPKSKRYAESDEDWNILLTRQNEIINELFSDNEKVFIVTGEYNWGERTKFITDEEDVFKTYNFLRLDNIALFEINSDDYDEDDIYRPAFAETTWCLNKHNNLLKAIANDETRAFFVSFDKNIIVAPYDGGLDLILKDTQTKDNYKEKYKEWLSEREDGL